MTPATLGPYRIERELGSGGMGKVYLATVADRVAGLETGASVALKVVHPHLLATPGFFKRFLREAELGASVRHDNVVRTFGCDQLTVDGVSHCFMAMEYVQGQTLSALRDELERVPEELCRHVARAICRGLAAIHEAGIVHRDIKPDNVLITPEHEVKLMDLGVAFPMDEAIRLSQTGAFVGSVEYAAPEQFKGGDVDGRTDLFALGVLLYEIAAGTHPHRGGGFHAILRRVLNDAPRPLGEVNPQLSAFFEEVVHTLLVKDPRGRFTSATQVLGVLEEGEESAWWHGRARALQSSTRRPLRRIRIPRQTAVYGREKEIAALRELFAKAQVGDGQAVLIQGEAGIGKSRLVDELMGRLQSDGEDLNFLFGSYPPNGAATASGAFSSAYREHFGEDGCAAYLAQTPVLVASFDALLAGENTPAGVEPLTKESLQTCFVTATRSLGAERVTVVLIDDLHFAPDESRALFTSLAMAVPGHRVLLIGTTRPGMNEGWQADLERFDHISRLAPQRLAAKDLVALLEESFQSKELAESLGLQIMVKSDGNPFFAFEIIRGLREGQFITRRADGSWAGTQVIDDIQIPASVLDLVNARVASLTEEERDLLDVACCWGYEFDPSLVGEVLGLARIPLLKRFGQIERAHRLVRASGRNYVFDHHQVQEALYGTLHEQMREEYHSALAEALENRTHAAGRDPAALDGALCVDLAEHFLKGGRGTEALRYLPAAQSHFGSNYLHAHAAALTERALAAPGLLTGVARATMLLRLAGVDGPLDRLGRRTRQEECAREIQRLADAADDDTLRIQAARALGWVLHRTSRDADAEAPFRRMLELAARAGDEAAEAAAASGLGLVLACQGHLEPAQTHWQRALVLSRKTGDRRSEAAIAGNLGNALSAQGHRAEARAHHERHIALSREIGDRVGEAGAMVNLGNVLDDEGRRTEARQHYEQGLALCREIGHRQFEANATGNLGNMIWAEGRLDEARRQYERHLVLSREIGDRAGEARATGNVGSVLQSQGLLAEAEEYHGRYLTISREIGYRPGEAAAQHNIGAVLRERGDLELAEQRLRLGLAVCEEVGLAHLAASTHLALGSLLAASNAETARESLAVALHLATESAFPDLQTLATCELACLPGGDAAAALVAFDEFEESLDADSRRVARYLLWKATGERAHLDAAKRLLDEAVARVDDHTRASMRSKLRVNREILAAWKAESGRGQHDDFRESPTSVG